jgi:hypothetical protein
VHGDARVGQLGQRRRRDTATTQVGPGAALGRDAADQDEDVVVQVAAGLGSPGGDRPRRVDAHPALDDRLGGAGAHGARVGPAAEEQPETGDHHGLAGSGLAGDDGEPGRELEHGVLDDAEAADPHLLQHGCRA